MPPRPSDRGGRRFLLLSAFFLFQASGGRAENPRSHLYVEPPSPKLSSKGFLFAAGPAFDFTGRRALYGGGGLPAIRLWGALGEAAYHVSEATGRWHAITSLGAGLFFRQYAYVNDFSGEAYLSDHLHLFAETFAGWSARRGARRRYFLSAGPTFNLLLWRLETLYSTILFGAGVNAGRVFTLSSSRSFWVAAKYKTLAREIDIFEDVIAERTHLFAVTAGVGL